MKNQRILKHIYILFFLSALPTIIEVSRRVNLYEFLFIAGLFIGIWLGLVFIFDHEFFQDTFQEIRKIKITYEKLDKSNEQNDRD